METFILENGWTIALAVIVAAFFAVVGYAAWHSRNAVSFNYPFDDPGYVHIGFNPAQLTALGSEIATLQTFRFCPRHIPAGTDATFYAMTESEFLKFHAELTKQVSALIADAARNNETFLRGPAATLSELLIGLDSIKRHLLPTPERLEFHPRHL